MKTLITIIRSVVGRLGGEHLIVGDWTDFLPDATPPVSLPVDIGWLSAASEDILEHELAGTMTAGKRRSSATAG